MVRVKVRFRVHLLRLVGFYQAYCTLVVRNCYVTCGVFISFQISRSAGISIATAILLRTSIMPANRPKCSLQYYLR